MTDSVHHSIFAGKDLSQASSQGITEADVLLTGVLASRPARQPDLAAENQALRTLAQHLMDEPQSLLKTLVGIALNLCRADTVGVSLLETAPNTESVFRWVAIAGALEPLEQTTTPGNFSPCGTTLACNQPQLYSHPERYFSYLYHPQFPMVEGLLIPLCVNDRPLGTLWILSHSGARHFDAEDQRLMMSFAGFGASALHRMQQVHQQAATALRQSEEFNQQILDSSDDCIKVLDLEGRILFMSRGGQALLEIQDITPFLNTPWVEFWPESDRQAAIETINRARAGEVCIVEGYCPTLNGEPKWWDNKISPIRGADGQVERLLCISRDITDRKRREAKAALLAEIGEDFSRLSTADEIIQVVGAKIGAYLKITTCNFTDVDEARGEVTVHHGWNSRDVPSTVGTFRITQYLSEEFERASRAGETVVIRDTQTDPRTDAASYAALNMHSFVTVPFHRNGRWTHYIAVCDSRPRDWRDDEIELIEEISNRIFPRLERARTESALRQSEQRFRLMADAVPQIVWITDAQGRVEFFNKQWSNYTGVPYEPTTAAEVAANFVHPDDGARTMEAFNQARCSGGVFSVEHRIRSAAGTYRWFLVRAEPYRDRQTGEIVRWFGASVDIHDRKRMEANLAFLAEIMADFAPLKTANEIMQIACAKTAAYFDLSGCLLVKISDAMDEAEVVFDFSADDLPSLVGTYPIADFHTEDEVQELAAGRVIVVNDVAAAPRTVEAADKFARLRIGALVNASYVSNGQWKFVLSAIHTKPRVWCIDEIELLQELSARVWLRIERAHAEAALRESEAKYRSLFESMDEGFCLIEVLFDETGIAYDYRFLEANPAFEKHTGLVDAIGKTIRELVPQLEAHWFEIYGKIALRGVPARFENSAKELGRFYDVYAFGSGEPHEHKVAVLFNDISERMRAEGERKQAEQTLQQAHNALRQQANQLEQANETLQSTLEELQITQEELRQQNEELAIARELAELQGHRYQDLFNFAPDGYVVTDAQGMIQEANQAFAALVAIDQHYLVNTPLAVYISETDRRAFRNLLYELHSSSGVQKLQTDELSLQHPRQHPIPVAITGTAICDTQSQIVGVRWLIQDITERKQAEAQREQLLGNERHYANQLQGLTNAALAINSALSVEEVLKVITDQAASIIGAHQSVTSMTIDQNWAQAINAVHLSEKYAQWRDYAEKTDGSGIYACVCHLNRPMRMTQAELEAHPCWKGFGKEADKHPPMRGWLAAPLVGRDGDNIGLLQLSDKYEGEFTPSDESILVQLAQMASVAVENARLYEAEQQARSAAEASREEAQAANRVKDEFLAVLSHELRSPLNPILGWSKLLQSRKLDETKTKQALSTIERNAKLQSELIEDLLDVSRILQGKLSLNVAPVNLASIIRAAMETVRLAAEAKLIQVEASLAPDVGLVWGDSTRLQQVIWNLLSNAVKFTPERGQVNIRLERLGSHAHITVSDTGQGIAPDFLPYVFDYFRQANAATTRKFGGLGLGLAIVRHLVELHGGMARAESLGEGQGATFVVQLPLMPNSLKANPDEYLPELSLDLNGIKILVVDDETDTREMVVFLLEQQGAQVRAATSAHEALLVLTQAKPDVLLSDIGMPDMDGYMLIQQVRTLAPEQGGQIPAIALTAYAGETNQQQVIAAGFQKHISKPIEPEVLVHAIAQLVRPT